MAEVLLLGLAAFLGGLGYGCWVLWVYLRHVRRRREHYLQHGHRRATMAAPRSPPMPAPILRYFDSEVPDPAGIHDAAHQAPAASGVRVPGAALGAMPAHAMPGRPAIVVARQVLDTRALYAAFEAAVRARPGRHSIHSVSLRLGIPVGALSRMKAGQYGSRTTAVLVLRMCAWAGLDPLDYLRDADDEARSLG